MAETLAQTVDRLQRTRDAAITSTTVDGISTTIDQTVVDKQLRARKRELAEEAGLSDPRPICARIKLT